MLQSRTYCFFLGRGEIAVIVDSKNGYMWKSIDHVKPRVIRSNVLSVKVTVVKFPVISTCRDNTDVFITLTGFFSKSVTELILS